MTRILLTGAAGIVGSALRPLLAERYPQVLLSDIVDMDPSVLADNEAFEQGDISDPDFVNRITSHVDGIVHLAGRVGPDYTFDQVLGPNIIGTHNVFSAAVSNGVKRVIYAGSHHAVGFLERGTKIDESTIPRPDSFYGISKAFGESVASYYSDRHGIHVLSIRIGFVGDEVVDERRLHTWISARDLCQLIDIGLSKEDLGHEVVYGVSENPAPFFDNSNAERLGYRPQDKAIEHLADDDILGTSADPNTIEGRYIGGHFAGRDESEP